MSMNSREMPKYVCHKTVWALKIKAIDGLTITPEESGYAAFAVTEEYMAKHNPEVGGYYVVYKDGYKSYSPAKAFEGGYEKIEVATSLVDKVEKVLASEIECEVFEKHVVPAFRVARSTIVGL